MRARKRAARRRMLAWGMSWMGNVQGGPVGAERLLHSDKGFHQDPLRVSEVPGDDRRISTASEWESRRQGILRGMEQAMGPYPGGGARPPLDVKVLSEDRFGEVIRRTITYQSSSNHRVPAILMLPAGATRRKMSAMLALHPTGELGKGIVAGLPGGRPNRQYGLELAQRGYVVLAPDYPTFGDYRTPPPDGEGFVSGTMRAVWDNSRGIDLLAEMSEVDHRRIGSIGHSLGGHNALFTAAFDPRIRVTVTSCGYTRFHRYYGGDLTGWTQPRYMPRIADQFGKDPDRMPFDFPEVLAAIAPRAIFTNAPLRDSNFDVRGVRESISAARRIYELLGGEHHLEAFYPSCDHDFPFEARARAYKFLDARLKP